VLLLLELYKKSMITNIAWKSNQCFSLWIWTIDVLYLGSTGAGMDHMNGCSQSIWGAFEKSNTNYCWKAIGQNYASLQNSTTWTALWSQTNGVVCKARLGICQLIDRHDLQLARKAVPSWLQPCKQYQFVVVSKTLCPL
jgi:hypothetical protein